ncbi:hypothetical protein [Rhizobium sp.]|uniref:hypothetical protein n=1 Tax=Rhizobium sp. TaxID=391 RepID=UPI00289BA23C
MNDDDGSNEAHWSGTFQRLRAETVIMAIVILAATQLELNLSKLPILGIEFSKAIPKGPVLLFLYLFFGYFTAAWFVRYRREKLKLETERRKIDDLRLQMIEVIDQTRSSTVSFAANVEASALVLQDNLRMLSSRHEEFLPHLSSAAKAYQDTVHRLHAVVNDGVRNGVIDRKEPIIAEAYRPHAIEEKIKQIYGSFADFKHVVKDAEKRVSVAVREARAEMEAKGPAFERAVDKLRGLVEIHLRRLRNLRSSIFYDLEFLGFYTPLVFSITLVVYSLPQGIADAQPTLMRIQDCLIHPERECFFRPSTKYTIIDLLQPPEEFLRQN